MFNKSVIFKSFKEIKYFIILYLVLLSLFTISFLDFNNFTHFTFKIVIFLIVSTIGLFSLIYYNYNQKDLHKIAFVIIILFGLICVFLTPICDVSDEAEHLSRTELVSQGQILTNYTLIPGFDVYGYKTINSTAELFLNRGNTVFDTEIDTQKIDYSTSYLNSAFSQNPFYGYIIPAIGVDFAKLLDLNIIWMLWFARLANLLMYAVICSIAIWKAPKFKLALTATACIPLAIYQGASVSIDAFINAFAILAIGYFIYFYNSKNKSLKWYEIGIFYGAILISGIIKFPFLFLSLLILLIPNTYFKNEKQLFISKLGILPTLAIGVIWTIGFSSNQLTNSWRGSYFIEHNVSSQGQIENIKSNPSRFLALTPQLIYKFPEFFARFFEFSNGENIYYSRTVGYIYLIIFWVLSFIYPLKEKIKNIDRVKVLIISLLIYLSTIAIQYLSWASVGGDNLLSGVFPRYFIPLLVFIPFIFNLNFNYKNEKLNLLVVTLIIMFISIMIMLTLNINY